MKNKRYKVVLTKEGTPMADQKKKELMLRDLLACLPTLKKHKLDGDIHKQVKVLRDGRKKKHYVLELSRKFATWDETNGSVMKELKVSAPITKAASKVEILKKLKGDLISQIQELRKAQKTPIEDFSFREGVTCKKMAEVYLEKGVFLKVNDKRLRLNITKKAKFPSSEDRYVGVEIELAAAEDREVLADLLHEAKLSRNVHIKGDSSIGRGTKLLEKYPNAIEIAILAKEEDIENVINKLCDILNNKMHCKVDKTCGLHVHLDMRNRKPSEAFSNLVTMQHFLYGMIPANRKSSEYSVPVKSKEWKISTSHYDGISTNAYSKYKTLEIRMHCGTTNASKIGNWIKFLLCIVNAPVLSFSPEAIEQVVDELKLSNELVYYINGRIAKFASQHKKNEKSPDTAGLTKLAVVSAAPDMTEAEESEVA